MDYKILSADATTFLGTDFSKASENLASQVNLAIRGGWSPLGGVAIGSAKRGRCTFLFQAMVKNNEGPA